MLVDSEASHSFISAHIAQELAIPTDVTVQHKIQVGNGMSFQQNGIYRGVRVLVRGQWVDEDFFPFELGSADLVLGVTWLKTLGEGASRLGKVHYQVSEGWEMGQLDRGPVLKLLPGKFPFFGSLMEPWGAGSTVETLLGGGWNTRPSNTSFDRGM